MSVIRTLHQQLINKERSALEIVQSSLERIQDLEPVLRSFLRVTSDYAIDHAKKVDDKIQNGESIGLLAGIPVAVKDNLCTVGIPTTCGSRILADF
ncbi:MAG: amidase family protein, partial [Synechococcales cyanobacterium]